MSIDASEAGGTFEILKEGEFTGVKVQLLSEDAIIVSGLKPEWPPWVRLEPHSNRILVSFDGSKWEDKSEQKDLWILRTLDPRPSLNLMRMLQPRDLHEKQIPARVNGNVSLSSFYRAVRLKTFLGTEAKVDEVADAILAQGDRTFYIEIEVGDNKIGQVNQRFVLSDELITLRPA